MYVTYVKLISCRLFLLVFIAAIFNTRTISSYTSRECINRFIYSVLRCWYFYHPVAFLLPFQFSFLILKTCSVHIHQWVLVKHKAIIISEAFWRKILRFSHPLSNGKKCTGRRRRVAFCPFAFYGFRAIFQLGVSKCIRPFSSSYRNRKSHYCSVVTFILGAR